MSKINPLAGLIGNYDDSEEEGDDTSMQSVAVIPPGVKAPLKTQPSEAARSGIHRAPISHCPWSACYDEASGFTYYWNQQTNAVTWEAPPEYLLALKIAQQQLNMGGSSQVSAAEWQMYQQVLAEQQTKSQTQPPAIGTTNDNVKKKLNVKNKSGYKRRISDEDEKIELITSYYHSDSESNDESESPVKAPPPPKPTLKPKVPAKKPKMKEKEPPIEYGPSLPPKQNYTVPIGPEMPTDYVITGSPKVKEGSRSTGEEEKLPTKIGDKQEESDLLKKLKDKARILEKLGGDIPPELQEIIEDKHEEAIDNTNPPNDSIDDLLSEIEKTELPKVKTKKIETIEEGNSKPGSQTSSPHRDLSEHKTLFPSAKNIDDDVSNKDIPNNSVVEKPERSASPPEKSSNIYLSDLSETKEVVRKKLRISNSVLPDRSKTETPSYTTKYSQFIEGFSSERTGLGFTQEPMEDDCPKTTISYGNGLTFTKGETLNEEKQEDDVDDLEELVVAKLKYLNQLETNTVTPIQEMFIQMQTLRAVRGAERGAERGAGGAAARYWRAWLQGAARALRTHEAPPGWTCDFLRAEGRYRYVRDSDGLVQWEYPAVATTDMDISTTPPHPGFEGKESAPPRSPPAPPPPPRWPDPPPPGCDEHPALAEEKREIGDELTSFYNDIAELEKHEPPRAAPPPAPAPLSVPLSASASASAPASAPVSAPASPEPPRAPRDADRERETKATKKKSKVKISSSIGMKQRTVSSLVAKWQQVADQIHSD